MQASPVGPNTAQQVAQNYMNAPAADANGVRRAPQKVKRMARVAKQVTNGQQFYVFNNVDEEGFVIVAADDVAHPILGYSHTGSFDAENIPDNLRWWLSEYNMQIKWAQENNIEQVSEIANEWNNLYNSEAFTSATPIVEPLIQTKWNQAPYYNALCPYNSLMGQRTVTGCVATALAQVMKYWEWPLTGNGYHSYYCSYYGTQSATFGAATYDWLNMPNELSDTSSFNQIYAVAQLIYHCGVSVDMDYGISLYDPILNKIRIADGSGAITAKVPDAVKTYFKYSDATEMISKNDYTDNNWTIALKNQLDILHPMVYAGGGHAFVCDGYDSQNYFHFNWGWGGFCDGWYPISALKPGPNGIGSGDTGDYTSNQRAVINMTPKSVTSTDVNLQLCTSWSLSSTSINYGGTLSGNVSVKNFGQTAFNGDITLLVLDEEYKYFTELPLKTNYTLAPNASVTLTPSVSQYAGLIPGRYYVTLIYNNSGEGFQLVGSEYYPNAATFSVYHSAGIEMYSNYVINSEDENLLIKGKKATVGVTIKNNSATNFTGALGLVIAQPDMSVGQDFAEVTIDGTGIPAGSTKTLSFTGRVTVDPGAYILALAYIPSNGNANIVGSTYYKNPICVNVVGTESGIMPGKYVVVANRDKDDDKNWYYMTSDLGTASTKRYQAVNTNTSSLLNVVASNLEDKYIWTIEADEDNWKLKNAAQYVTWISGNSANFDNVGKSLSLDVTGNSTRVHFNDGTDERYLSLNSSSSYNYFAFYKGTSQTSDLYFLPYEEPEEITIRAKMPEDWGNTISAWVWGENNSGSWAYLTFNDGWYEYTTVGYEANIIFVNGSTWSSDNNQTVDISIKGSACVVVGDEISGKRSYTFVDCPHRITVKAKIPSDWTNTISAWVWDEGHEGEWVTLSHNGEWYTYTRYCNTLNIVYLNGTTWNGDNNQTIDISTQHNACYQINSSTGKRYAIQIECEEETPNPQPETDNYIVLAQRNASSNWFYMTSDFGTASTKRYQAVDAGTSTLANVNTTNLDSKYYWQIEGNKLHTEAGYSTWASGNSANLDATGKDLTIVQQTGRTYTFSFADGEDTRYLALNKTDGNNYFAYYKGTGQIYKLTLIKEGETDVATGIEETFSQPAARKILRDGQLLILRDGKTYTVQGQEVR